MSIETIFQPLRFRTLEVKHRVLRSSLAGRFNSYDGMGTPIHVNWERPAATAVHFSNKCLFTLLESPLGCYDERRYDSREEMRREIASVFDPPSFTESAQR